MQCLNTKGHSILFMPLVSIIARAISSRVFQSLSAMAAFSCKYGAVFLCSIPCAASTAVNSSEINSPALSDWIARTTSDCTLYRTAGLALFTTLENQEMYFSSADVAALFVLRKYTFVYRVASSVNWII